MAPDAAYFVIEVLNYQPYRVGFALSAKDGWFVGKRRFCGLSKARRFVTQTDADAYIANRYDHGKYEFRVIKANQWDS